MEMKVLWIVISKGLFMELHSSHRNWSKMQPKPGPSKISSVDFLLKLVGKVSSFFFGYNQEE
jgi:hypothetical protein